MIQIFSGISWQGLGMKIKIRGLFSAHSASLSGGNLVDGLPRALHTGAVGVPHGGAGPATIYALEFEKLRFEEKCRGKFPKYASSI